MISQTQIDASVVLRFRIDITMLTHAGRTQQCRQILFCFYFRQGKNIRITNIAGHRQDFGQLMGFMPKTLRRPMIIALRQESVILLERVIFRVEIIFCVIEQQSQIILRIKACLTSTNKQQAQEQAPMQ